MIRVIELVVREAAGAERMPSNHSIPIEARQSAWRQACHRVYAIEATCCNVVMQCCNARLQCSIFQTTAHSVVLVRGEPRRAEMGYSGTAKGDRRRVGGRGNGRGKCKKISVSNLVLKRGKLALAGAKRDCKGQGPV